MKKLFIIAILNCNFLNAQNVFPTTGNVGIGTTAPAEKLEVNGGNIFLNSTVGQFIRWGTPGSAPPSFTTRSAGTKLVLWPGVGAGLADYAIGIDQYTLWQGVPINDTNHSHKFYGGTTPLMTIRGDGNVGIGTVNPTNKLAVHAGHLDSNILLHSNGDGINESNQADLMLWASEPWITYTGVGIGNNVKNWNVATGTGKISRISNLRGGSYIRLLDNSINFNLVSNSGTDQSALTLYGNGNVGIGTVNPAYKLDVIGTIRAREVRVNLDGADFVFEDGYRLMPLNELEKFVKQNKHLPEIAPAKEMQKKGSDLGSLSVQLLQKIEELTLHVIEQNKKMNLQNKEINSLKEQNKEINFLKEKMRKLEQNKK